MSRPFTIPGTSDRRRSYVDGENLPDVLTKPLVSNWAGVIGSRQGKGDGCGHGGVDPTVGSLEG